MTRNYFSYYSVIVLIALISWSKYLSTNHRVILDTFCVVSVTVIGFVYISTPVTFYMGHMSFFDVFFNGSWFYPQPPQLSVHSLWIDISINLLALGHVMNMIKSKILKPPSILPWPWKHYICLHCSSTCHIMQETHGQCAFYDLCFISCIKISIHKPCNALITIVVWG